MMIAADPVPTAAMILIVTAQSVAGIADHAQVMTGRKRRQPSSISNLPGEVNRENGFDICFIAGGRKCGGAHGQLRSSRTRHGVSSQLVTRHRCRVSHRRS